jgi:hypothetical protein
MSFSGDILVYTINGELEHFVTYHNGILVTRVDIDALSEHTNNSQSGRSTNCSEFPNPNDPEEFLEWVENCASQDEIIVTTSLNTLEQGDSPSGGLPFNNPDIGTPSYIINPVNDGNSTSSGGSGAGGEGGSLPHSTIDNEVEPKPAQISIVIGLNVDEALQEAMAWLNNEASKDLLESLARFLNNNKDRSQIEPSMTIDVPDSQLPEVTPEAADFATDIIEFVRNGGDEECAINALNGVGLLSECGQEQDDELAEICTKIKEQIDNSDYQGKIAELKEAARASSSFAVEEGYWFPLNGGSPEHVVAPSDRPDRLIPPDGTYIGSMHCHLRDKIVTVGGLERKDRRLKIFSPKDLNTFLRHLRNAHQNNQDYKDVFSVLVTPGKTWTLRFSGDIEELLGQFHTLRGNILGPDGNNRYISLVRKNTVKGFLKFVKERMPGIEGLNLYQIKDDGTVTRRYLDELGKVKTEQCEN